MRILVTGGAGYIGSHVVKELLTAGHSLLTLDNLATGHRASLVGGKFIECDLKNKKRLQEIFEQFQPQALIHLAADSLVGESVERPQQYYHNNLLGSINLLDVMLDYGLKKIVYSSTAAVYGEAQEIPLREDSPTNPTNPYGRSKLYFTRIMQDYERAYGLRFISLRYFNASGADPSGRMGEDHNPETHLIPIVLERALGLREELVVFGTDYQTRDGTCIRDYIHVSDLARAHLLAVEALAKGHSGAIYNLGSGTGYSVQEVIETAREITGSKIPCREGDRRPGDPPVLIASSELIKKELGWQPEYQDLKLMIETAWRWHRNNPQGYRGRESN